MTAIASFSHFGPSHLAALGVIATLALPAWGVLSRRPLPALRGWGRRLLGAFLLLQLTGWHLVFGLRGPFSPATDLPLHLCDINQLLLALYLFRPRPRLFDVLYHWVLAGSALALLLPDLGRDFPSLIYFSLFTSHGLTLLLMGYLAFGQGKRPGPAGAEWAGAALVGCGLVMVPVNQLLGGNYLYLATLPELPLPFTEHIPPAPWYWPLLAGAMYLLFRGLYRLAPRP
jgi:hypothetical integral membrane protein (TIGR02206 family)